MNAGLRLEFSYEKIRLKNNPMEYSAPQLKKKTEYFVTLSKSFIIYGK